MNDIGFVMCSPWYFREREQVDLRSPLAHRPRLQMYDAPDFVDRMLADPADSVEFGADDVWTYPVPVTSPSGNGRARLATSRLVPTHLRKLYQPLHERFYVVVVEVLCDAPGLPRAGRHEDITVGFRMRRLHTCVTGKGQPSRRVASKLVAELAKDPALEKAANAPDVRDVWWADTAWRERFKKANEDDLAKIDWSTDVQRWLTSPGGGGRWATVCSPADAPTPGETEELVPMTRMPVRSRDKECADDAGPAGPASRSLWFGVVPTYSGDHWMAPRPGGRPDAIEPKLDPHAIYEIECVVTRVRPGCPPETWASAPTEPFRLADPMDPAGTKNRTVTITLPDFRRLAARAGEPQGPGGVRIVTPPGSQMKFSPFGGPPGSGKGVIGAGAAVCTFAIELLFIVAFFLFLMFLPIVVLAFQLWWMLALRFCIPPRVGFAAMEDFLATASLGSLSADARAEFNLAMGMDFRDVPIDGDHPDWAGALDDADLPDGAGKVFAGNHNLTHALVAGTDPTTAVPPAPLPRTDSPDDPLCPATRSR
ncbi:hypothetical protein [Demequina mangrovi]|uniref:Uncharacterized protein n=1 Tax=Demequina mangrovi TaxID=1043493 RepID=A0A1H6U2N3_9MICO|nr:hypothetical protein [Demequina mangrovi]SEI82675.1 hypothetical protein SAMN05421637_0117 [Demequina mangrovi]